MKSLMPLRLRKYLLKKKPTVALPPLLHIYPYRLSVLAIFKNEAFNMKVWIEHYLWMGVDHFFLIDNGSTDGSQQVLRPFIEKGIVSVFFMPEKWKQTEHYQYVYKNFIINKSQWVIVADLDEFWYVYRSTIRRELCNFQQYHVITSHWRWFGYDGNIQHPKDIRTTNLHRKKELQKDTKYIFQTKHVQPEQLWIHNVIGKVDKRIDASHTFRLNHYILQSREYFETVKMTRGAADSLQHEFVRNEEYFNLANADTDFLDTDLKEMVELYQRLETKS